MTRLLLVFAAFLALPPVDALAGEDKLNGAEIDAAYSGANMSFKTSYGTFFSVWDADGTMTSRDVTGVVPDKGKWWVQGDRICRKWDFWFGAKEECFDVTLDGDKVKWWRADGSEMYLNSPITLTK